MWVKGEERDLTEIEYQILRLLMQKPQWTFSAQAIYESIWNEPYFHFQRHGNGAYPKAAHEN